jgi:hypothetical protein
MMRIIRLLTAWLDGKQGGGTPRVLGILVGGVLLALAGTAHGYPQYSESRDATNCRACHGDFRASPYTSLVDGIAWADGLHDVHRNIMLDGDCDTCHGTGPRFPVLIGSSAGGIGLDPISCSGCHGRAADGTDPGVTSEGYGAGLRQHHWRAGEQICLDCHADADPAAFTPVGEEVFPPYYFSPPGGDLDHPTIPSHPCNPLIHGYPEDYAGSTLGLDNDGDDLYDELEEPICVPEPDELILLGAGVGFLLVIGRRRRR